MNPHAQFSPSSISPSTLYPPLFPHHNPTSTLSVPQPSRGQLNQTPWNGKKLHPASWFQHLLVLSKKRQVLHHAHSPCPPQHWPLQWASETRSHPPWGSAWAGPQQGRRNQVVLLIFWNSSTCSRPGRGGEIPTATSGRLPASQPTLPSATSVVTLVLLAWGAGPCGGRASPAARGSAGGR